MVRPLFASSVIEQSQKHSRLRSIPKLIETGSLNMRKTLIVLAVAASLSACDSEGIDRVDFANIGGSDQTSSEQSTDENSLSSDSAGTPTASSPIADDVTDSNESDNSTNPLGGSGSSDGGENSTNPLGGSGSSDGGENSTNPLGGSGSSDGGNSGTDDSADNSTGDGGTGESSTLFLDPPTTGTTFVSTMSPIRSTQTEHTITPSLDENNNPIMNGNCPVVQFHDNLKFGDFILATNAWNFCASSLPNWVQTISVSESNGKVMPRWDYDWGNESDVRGAVWLVKSYPEIIYGIKSPNEFSGSSLNETPVETGLPARVDDLPFFKIDYAFSSDEYPTRSKEFNGQTLNGERNVAIESFFHELGGDCDIDTLVRNGNESNQRFEIMVWVDRGEERLPAAPNDYVTSAELDGIMYDIYTKPSDEEYIAFVAQNPTTSGELNWTTFIEWTRTYSHRVNEVFGRGFDTVKLQDDWCMANILLGTEIWWGNGYFQADEWTIHRTVR